ncbi:hypothetical protein QJS66_06520 [Kocuria rhizophila]|nr:hypothetical protein QJS66_06520 [Kocuria rhizophila]
MHEPTLPTGGVMTPWPDPDVDAAAAHAAAVGLGRDPEGHAPLVPVQPGDPRTVERVQEAASARSAWASPGRQQLPTLDIMSYRVARFQSRLAGTPAGGGGATAAAVVQERFDP